MDQGVTYMETDLPSKYLPTTTKFSDFVLFQVENCADEEDINIHQPSVKEIRINLFYHFYNQTACD